MKASDWGESLTEARDANPGLPLGKISTIASEIHHAKRKAAATKSRVRGKKAAKEPSRHCVKWEYTGEGNKKPPHKIRIPVRSKPPVALDVD